MRPASHRPLTVMRSLRQCLLDTDPVVLRVIADALVARSDRPEAARSGRAARRNDRHAGPRATVIWRSAAAGADALRALLAAGGTLPVANFSQRFGSIRSVGPARLEREQLWRTPISPAENLWYLGLLYRGFEQLPNGAMREVFFAPGRAAAAAAAARKRPIDPSSRWRSPLRRRTSDASGEALADDLCTLLSHLHNNFVRSADRATAIGGRTAAIDAGHTTARHTGLPPGVPAASRRARPPDQDQPASACGPIRSTAPIGCARPGSISCACLV